MNKRLLRSEVSQALILVAVALPMFFSLVAVIIDGTNLMVHRRSLQNAADATSLAMAQSVDVSAGTCDATCADIGRQYAQKNGLDVTATTPTWHPCIAGNASDTNCWAAPYVDKAGHSHPGQVEVRLRDDSIAGFFTSAVGLGSLFSVSARSVSSATGVTHVTPGATNTITTGGMTLTVVTPPSTSTKTTTIPGSGLFAYAGDTSCSAVIINNGKDHFGAGGLWANGAVNSSSSGGNLNDATLVNVTRPPPDCAYQGFSTPQGVTQRTPRVNGGFSSPLTLNAVAGATVITLASTAGFAANAEAIIGSGATAEIRKVSSKTATTLTLAAGLSSTHAAGQIVSNSTTGADAAVLTANASAGATTLTVDDSSAFSANQTIWIDQAGANPETRIVLAAPTATTITLTLGLSSAHTSGTTVTNADWLLALPNITVSCTSGGVTIDAAWLAAHQPGRYCFTGIIKLTASFSGYGFISRDSTDPAAIGTTDNGLSFAGIGGVSGGLLFFALHGGLKVTPGGGSTITGQMFAPEGPITLTGGTNTQSGFSEGQTLTLTGSGTTFIGSGPTGDDATSTSTTTFPGSTNFVTVPPNTTVTTSPPSTATTGTTIGLGE